MFLKNLESSKTKTLPIDKLDDKQRISLFGEPTKKIKNLGIFNRRASETPKDLENKKTSPELVPFVQNKVSNIKAGGVVSFFQRFVIHYNSPYKSVWDVFILLLIAYNCLTSAYYATFEEIDELQALEKFGEVCFGLDILLKFIHSYKDPATLELVVNFKAIALNYMKSWFLIDLVAILPISYIFGGQGQEIKLVRMIRLPRFMKLLDSSKIEQLLEAMLQNSSQKEKMNYIYISRYVYKILRLIIIAVFLAYFIGCFWYFIITMDYNLREPHNFFDNYGLASLSMFDRLITCCYFTMTTLATVGYGDYSPTTKLEKIVGIFIMILGIAFFSYIMGNFNDVITNYEKKLGVNNQESDLQLWLTSLTKFTSNKPLPKRILRKIDDHFKHYWKHDRLAGLTINDKYLTTLPKPLRYDIIKYLFEDIFTLFRGFLLMKEFRDSMFYYELAFEFLPRKYEAGETILKQKQEVQEIYFIIEGELMVGLPYKDICVERFFKRGYYFGNYNVFTGYPSEYDYKATTLIKAMAISKQRFLKILDKYSSIKSAMLSYSFRMAKETSKAMVNALKNTIKKSFHEEVSNEEASRIYKELIESTRKDAQRNIIYKVPTIKSDMKINEVSARLNALDERVKDISKKLSEVKDAIGQDFEALKDKVEKIKISLIE